MHNINNNFIGLKILEGSNITVMYGTGATITCTTDLKVDELLWLLNGQTVARTKELMSLKLAIPLIKDDYTPGVFTCLAVNSFGNQSRSITVNIGMLMNDYDYNYFKEFLFAVVAATSTLGIISTPMESPTTVTHLTTEPTQASSQSIVIATSIIGTLLLVLVAVAITIATLCIAKKL